MRNITLLLVGFLNLAVSLEVAIADHRPNFVLVMADDKCHGSPLNSVNMRENTSETRSRGVF